MTDVSTTAYVELIAYRNYSGTVSGMKVNKVTQNAPTTRAYDSVLLKVAFQIPKEAFEPIALSVVATVGSGVYEAQATVEEPDPITEEVPA